MAGQDKPAKPDSITVSELCLRFLIEKAKTVPSTECRRIVITKDLVNLYGNELAADFTVLKLKTLQFHFQGEHQNCKGKLRTRTYVNELVNTVKEMFRWGAGNGLIPASVPEGLKYLEPLKAGKCASPEGIPRREIPQDIIDKTLAKLSPTVANIVRLQLATTARPTEILKLKIEDINRSNPDLWTAELKEHKNAHRGQERVLHFNREAQQIILSVIKDRTEGYVFRPEDTMQYDKQRRAASASGKNSKKQPSRAKRDAERAANPKRKDKDCYTKETYRRAVARACERAGVENWCPYEIRHTSVSRISLEYGLDAARAAAGQKTISITARYNHSDRELARRLAAGELKPAVPPEKNSANLPNTQPAAPDNTALMQIIQQQNAIIAMLAAQSGVKLPVFETKTLLLTQNDGGN